jgi:3,4-dihydroxy 2-butanone 4-phosphate synthase/GTP cyclohydrolase II
VEIGTPVRRCAVAVDAATGVGTGISARDRARTARLLADPAAVAGDFVRPGHVVPVRVDTGARYRHGPAEAAVDLALFAGLRPAAVLAAVVSTRCPEAMADPVELGVFAATHGLAVVALDDFVAASWRRTDRAAVVAPA